MKVLHVINSLAAGGAEKLVSQLAAEQSKTMTVGIFTFSKQNDIFRSLLVDAVKQHGLDNDAFFSYKKIKKLFETIKKYDVIHVHLFPSLYIVAMLSFFCKNKTFIVTEHNTYNRRRKWYFLMIEKFIYSRFHKIICISESVLRNLEDWIGKSPSKEIIPNFIDLKLIRNSVPINKSEISAENSILLVMVGSFTPQKDQETIIKSLIKLPEKFELILIGDGPNRNYLESVVQENKLEDRVVFLGIKKNVSSILKSCNYGILSSNWEGFGIVALEYMAAELITFGSNVPGLNEVIPFKENLFSKGSHEDLAKKILHIHNNTKEMEQQLAMQNVYIKKYDISYSVASHLNIYNEFCEI